MNEMETEPESPSDHETTPPWRKRKLVDHEDHGEALEPADSKHRTPRPAFEPMKFSSNAAFMAHVKQIDPIIEQVKAVCRLKKYGSVFDSWQQILVQMETELRINYPLTLLADEQVKTSQKLVRLRRYILELQNRKYCLLWNEMCQKLEPANSIRTHSEPPEKQNVVVTDPRVRFAESTETSPEGPNSVDKSQKQTTREFPSMKQNPEFPKSTKISPAPRNSPRNLKACESNIAEPLQSSIPNNQAGEFVERKAAIPNSADAQAGKIDEVDSRPDQLAATSSRRDSAAEIPQKRSVLGKSSKQNLNTRKASADNSVTSTCYTTNYDPEDLSFENIRTPKRSRDYEWDSDQSADPRPRNKIRIPRLIIDIEQQNTESRFQRYHQRDCSPSYKERSPSYTERSPYSNTSARSRPRSRGRPLRSKVVPANGVTSSRKCNFCDGNHQSYNCTVVNTFGERLEFFKFNDLCRNCGRKSHKYECKRHYCKWNCRIRSVHHSSICPQAPYPITRQGIIRSVLNKRV